ncbi:MAG: ImmA/IrrE family metallo-endopeptidase [Bacteroidetes bacterium]|nr:ImmA/IrrE family metallo-endopeptidase [Bacteroidota bacterium]
MEIRNLKRLSKHDIENQSVKVLHHFNENYFSLIRPTPLNDIVNNLVRQDYLKYEELILGYANDGSRILGCYIPNKKFILIDPTLKSNQKSKFNFVLGHELGHFVLHRNLVTPVNDEDIQDSDTKIFSEKKELVTDLDFMEWQANYFSSVILLPKDMLYNKLIRVVEKLGMRWKGRIFVDSQRCNQTDYYNVLAMLCDFFEVSKTVAEIRLKELRLLIDKRAIAKSIGDILNENK